MGSGRQLQHRCECDLQGQNPSFDEEDHSAYLAANRLADSPASYEECAVLKALLVPLPGVPEKR